ncbi:hypothetical protein ACP6L2_05375 [Sphingobacterium lactis]|uniref:hypothetical protein n=1 Tax=Sphingobacterium lactis TaxID=797291 RepID=UPI003F81AB6E
MEKLTLASYIISDKRYTVRALNKIDLSKFVNIDDVGQLDSSKIDPDYITGAIIMKYNDQTILDYSDWDDLNYFWPYFIDALDELLENNNSKFSFPSQALPVNMEIVKDRLIFQVGQHRLNMQARDFYEIVLVEGNKFYKALLELFPRFESEYNSELQKIDQLIKKSKVKFSKYG